MTSVFCKNCKYFTPVGKCRKFRYQDLVYGDFKYPTAHYARTYEELCGVKGKYYKEVNVSENTCPVIMCSPEGGCSVIVGPCNEDGYVVYKGAEE